jgi:hypothetical protein
MTVQFKYCLWLSHKICFVSIKIDHPNLDFKLVASIVNSKSF